MFRLIKWVFYLGIIGFIALVGYAYIGPFVGADFSAATREIREEIILDAQ
jgi:hypothetical protein